VNSDVNKSSNEITSKVHDGSTYKVPWSYEMEDNTHQPSLTHLMELESYSSVLAARDEAGISSKLATRSVIAVLDFLTLGTNVAGKLHVLRSVTWSRYVEFQVDCFERLGNRARLLNAGQIKTRELVKPCATTA
jgi:hypothetical protein